MDKVKRMILKARQHVGQRYDYIAWTLVNPRDGGYKAQIMYYGHVPETEQEAEYVTGKTREEVVEKVSLLAEKHGQNEVMFIHFAF